jgi:hypothetical protein
MTKKLKRRCGSGWDDSQKILRCAFRRTGKAMGQVYPMLVENICREIHVFFFRFEHHMFTFYIHLWPIYWLSLISMTGISWLSSVLQDKRWDKVKIKLSLVLNYTRHMREWRYSSTFLNLDTSRRCGKLHAPAALSPVPAADLVAPEQVWTQIEWSKISAATRNWTPVVQL